MIAIDKGVPIPGRTKRKFTRYPWLRMEVGDSITVDEPDIVQSAYKYGRAHKRVFLRRMTGKGQWRIWRTN